MARWGTQRMEQYDVSNLIGEKTQSYIVAS